MENKKLRYIVIALITIALLFGFATKTYAGFIKYNGKPPSHPGLGVWWTGEGVGTAWSTFYNAQMKVSPPKYRTETKFREVVNKGGNGAPKPDGSYETFWETCQKSKYIYWYGSYRVWQDKKKGYSYFPQTWYTQGNGTHHANWNSNSPGAKKTFEEYKAWSSQWTKGRVILICSFAFEDEEEIPLFFKANSGTFTYDGSLKTVEGLHPSSDVSKLKAGHRYEAIAKRSEKEVGTYPVIFSKIVIYDENNKDITESGLYKITSEDGQLKINDKPPPPPPTLKEKEEEVEWRCVDYDDDSASAYVFNETIGYHGFTPTGAGTLRSTYGSRYTPAGIFAMSNPPPRKYDLLSEWRSWKSTYQSGSDTITRELNLLGAGVSEVLSKYGGVYNIDRSLRKDTYEIEHCQPQERYLEKITESGSSIRIKRESDWDHYMYEEIYIEYDGGRGRDDIEGTVIDYYYGRYPEDDEICVRDNRGRREWILLEDITYWEMTSEEWTPWEDVGGRIVWNNWGPYRDYDEFNYQLLSVNCNKQEFNNIMSSYGDRNLSFANGDGGASLKTRETRGAGPGVLGRGSHRTAHDSFYLDGDSCDVFACTADPFPSAYHDGQNNKNNKYFFQAEYNDGREFGKPKDDKNEGWLVYFRDNEDNDVRADIWYPKSTRLSDLISYPEERAIGTLGKLFGGTPEIELTTIMPKWGYGRAFSRVGEELWWRGEENNFIMKSQWASYKEKPYELGLIWEYEAEGINHVPAKANGYDVTGMTQPYYYWFDIACHFYNNGNDKKALIPESPFIYSRISNSQYNGFWNPAHAIRTLFVRSVSQ